MKKRTNITPPIHATQDMQNLFSDPGQPLGASKEEDLEKNLKLHFEMYPPSGHKHITFGASHLTEKKEKMKNKVTSYELSKRLDELGFDCNSHTGWWGLDVATPDIIEWFESSYYVHGRCKAYDCHDLLMWLSPNTNLDLCNVLDPFNGDLWESRINPSGDEPNSYHEKPQESLGLSIVKILQLRKEGELCE